MDRVACGSGSSARPSAVWGLGDPAKGRKKMGHKSSGGEGGTIGERTQRKANTASSCVSPFARQVALGANWSRSRRTHSESCRVSCAPTWRAGSGATTPAPAASCTPPQRGTWWWWPRPAGPRPTSAGPRRRASASCWPTTAWRPSPGSRAARREPAPARPPPSSGRASPRWASPAPSKSSPRPTGTSWSWCAACWPSPSWPFPRSSSTETGITWSRCWSRASAPAPPPLPSRSRRSRGWRGRPRRACPWTVTPSPCPRPITGATRR